MSGYLMFLYAALTALSVSVFIIAAVCRRER